MINIAIKASDQNGEIDSKNGLQRFCVPSKREKCPPRVETAASKRQTREMSGHVTLSVVRGKKLRGA